MLFLGKGARLTPRCSAVPVRCADGWNKTAPYERDFWRIVMRSRIVAWTTSHMAIGRLNSAFMRAETVLSSRPKQAGGRDARFMRAGAVL